MTEKRFELNKIVKVGTVSFWDNENQKIVNATATLNLLNELSKENEKLKQQNIYLEDEVSKLVNTVSKFPKQLEDSRKECRDMEMKLNTLKKWYIRGGNATFNNREMEYLKSLRGDFECLKKNMN